MKTCVAILGTVLFVIAPEVAAAQTAAVAPAVGPPTSQVTVALTGFGPAAAIDVYFDTTDTCLVLASGTGAGSCIIRVPSTAQPQYHWISAVQRSTGTGAQKAFTVRTDWAQFHGLNAAHNGRNPYENTLTPANVGNLDVLWSAPIGAGGATSTPAVAGGVVYVGGVNGKLYSFNATVGTSTAGFPVTLGGPVTWSSPAVGFGNVYIGTDAPDDKVYAINTKTGAAVPGFPAALQNATKSAPALLQSAGQSLLFISDTNGTTYQIGALTGAIFKWFPITCICGSVGSVTVGQGHVYIGSFSSTQAMYAFDAIQGGPLGGSFPVATLASSGIQDAAAVSGGNLFWGADDGQLYGVNATTGEAIAGFPIFGGSTTIDTTPAIEGGRVFAGYYNTHVFCAYSATNGSTLWCVNVDGPVSGSPIVANGVVFATTPHHIYAFATTDGTLLGSVSVASHFPAGPALANGILYMASTDGNLYAFSVNGVTPSSRLPGGAAGVMPAISSLRPDPALRPERDTR